MAVFELTASPSPEELAAITDALSAFNTGDVGPSDRRPLAILIRDADGKVTGGLSGFTAWGWLFVQMLYLPETLRGAGIAGRILAQAEKEAKARGCHGAWIDTFSPRALRAYLRRGYEVFGELEDFPQGRMRSFLRKKL
ncbi:GNAT family N-acetyltransferase [Rhizobium sp. 9T]|uniref:GNAT family N-acetyltransferase n=1 Tax=Rhizobium croatiense TaxID=2867516 RepID=UPI001C93603E|nr:GNAT family N-acetyltransferase [Rhizobium croatiense]MBY4609786.1 GNAT family N-acetyltransferase [Rhizobium croatiense]